MRWLCAVVSVVFVFLSLVPSGCCESAPSMCLKLSAVSGVTERCAPASVTFAVSVEPETERCRVAGIRFSRAATPGREFRTVATTCCPDPFDWQAWETEQGSPVYRAEALDCSGNTLAVSNEVRLRLAPCVCQCSNNGITVMPPKYFDQRSLESMLEGARRAYSQVAFPNMTELYSQVGAIQGASAQETITTATLQAPASPGTTPSVPQLPKPSVLIPYQPQFSLAASDILAQQQQLYYEFAGYSLLAENSITDRVLEQTGTACEDRVYFSPRARPVVGFSVNIEQPPCYADAVAEIDVVVCPGSRDTIESEVPFVVNLVPQSKTYNVASMRRDVSSIGFGAVVGMMQLGGAGSKQSESVYLVKDTDTVAFERPRCTCDGERAAGAHFAWQFRPVLGQHMIETARRQVYVTLGLPVDAFKPWLGKVFVTTSWHRIVKQGNTWKGVEPKPMEGSVNEQIPMLLYIPSSYRVQKGMRHVENVLWEDVGGCNVAVAVLGKFDPGYFVNIGGRNFATEQCLASSTGRIKFVARALDLMRNDALLLDRFGVATKIEVPERYRVPGECIQITDARVTPLDATYSSVAVTISNSITHRTIVDFMAMPTHQTGMPTTHKEPGPGSFTSNPGRLWSADIMGTGREWSEMGETPNHKPLFLIGDTVYGLSDSPVVYHDNGDGSVSCTMRVPTEQIRKSPELIVKDVLWGPSFLAGVRLTIKPDFSVVLIKDADACDARVTIAVTGTDLPESINSYRVYLGGYEVEQRMPDPLPKPCAYKIEALSTDSQFVFTADKSLLEGLNYMIISRGPGQPPIFVPCPSKRSQTSSYPDRP